MSIIKGDFLALGIVGIVHLVGHLNFIDKQIKPLVLSLNTSANISGKLQRISVFDITRKVKLNLDDLLFRNARLHQMLFEQPSQQKRLPAAAYSRDNLNLSVPHILNQLVQISISFYLHKIIPLENFGANQLYYLILYTVYRALSRVSLKSIVSFCCNIQMKAREKIRERFERVQINVPSFEI